MSEFDLLARLSAAVADRYTVTREVARGGMSVIYHATDRRHPREVAIKVLRPEIAATVTVDRFLQEIRIESKLQHPHIVPLLDSGVAGDLPFCVLPFIKGPTLRDKLRAEGQLPVDEALRITAQVGAALEHAHRAGIVHRDVKPENILLNEGLAVLADFGIARAITRSATDRFTSEGMIVGTAMYMSPEQAEDDYPIDGRCDLYSLAIVLFEMLAGEPPFLGRTVQAILAKHRTETAPSLLTLRPTVPESVAAAVARALAKSPADRFPDIASFLAALHAPSPRQQRRVRRAVATAVGITTLAVVGWCAWPRTLDANTVVVFPVRDLAVASEGSGTHDVAYAIELALDHARPLKWRHGWDWLDEATRDDPTRFDAAAGTRISRRHRARYFIDGTIQRAAGEDAVVLRLYDALGDTVVAIERASAAAPGDLAALGVTATRGLLLRWLAPGRAEHLEPLRAVAPAAMALQVQGEREYRDARFQRALDLFERALAQDSTFAYAAVRAAQAASWLNLLPRAQGLVRRARAMEASLPLQYRPFVAGLDAYLHGRADSATHFLRAALAVAPDWDEAHMALGEVHYHLLAREAEGGPYTAHFDSATARDTTFTPPLMHLAEDAARRGDVATLERYIARLRAREADASWVRTLLLQRDCLRDPGRVSWDEAVAQDPIAVLSAAKSLGVGVAQPGCAEAGWRALLANSTDAGVRWGALQGYHAQLVAQGQDEVALQVLDSARTNGTSAVLYLLVLDGLSGSSYPERADSVLSFAAARFGDSYERASPITQWLVAMWHAHRGDRAMVERIATRVAASADSAPASRRLALIRDAIAARVPLVQGDTAEAIRRLEALRPTAQRDSLSFDFFEPLAAERLLLAQLLYATGESRRAIDVASAFEHTEPVAYVGFLRASLSLRADAAESIGRRGDAAEYRARLNAMSRTRGSGSR